MIGVAAEPDGPEPFDRSICEAARARWFVYELKAAFVVMPGQVSSDGRMSPFGFAVTRVTV